MKRAVLHPIVLLTFTLGLAASGPARAAEPGSIFGMPATFPVGGPDAAGDLLVIQQVTGEANLLETRVTLSAESSAAPPHAAVSGFPGQSVPSAGLEAVVAGVSTRSSLSGAGSHRVNLIQSSFQGFRGFALVQQVNGRGNTVSSTLSVRAGGALE